MSKIKTSKAGKKAAKTFIKRIKTGVLKPMPDPTTRKPTTEQKVKHVLDQLRRHLKVCGKTLDKNLKILKGKKSDEVKVAAAVEYDRAYGAQIAYMTAMVEVAKEFGE